LIIIRKFEPPDFPYIIETEKKVFNEHDPYFYMQFYETCPDSFIVAEMNGMVVGYVIGFQTIEKTGRIFSLAVDPGYRNMGIGGALLEEILAIFGREGISEIVLEVRSDNVKAQRFYKRHGFLKFGMIEKYYNDGENATLMKRLPFS
jgi:ribosomal-protein-alanine N-acetyltransferase